MPRCDCLLDSSFDGPNGPRCRMFPPCFAPCLQLRTVDFNANPFFSSSPHCMMKEEADAER
eukprot:1373263-Rhodomonas_salina.4